MSRFIKLNAAGEQLPADATGHVAVLDTETGLTWSVAIVGAKPVAHAKALELAAAIDLLGEKDWRLPTRKELLSLVDDTRYAPAIDTDAFPDTRGWFWSSSPYAGNPECAWVVVFSYGGSYCGHRGGLGFVRAVRGPSPRASQ